MPAFTRAMVALSAFLLLLSALAAARTSGPGHPNAKKKAAIHSSRSSSKAARSKSRKSGTTQRASRRNWRRKGQQAIQSDRAREIQTALIRERYLTGEPSGVWDDSTRKALMQYQGDHGWQTKRLPDARALIELGLGPTHDGLLNPESIASTERPVTSPPNARPR